MAVNLLKRCHWELAMTQHSATERVRAYFGTAECRHALCTYMSALDAYVSVGLGGGRVLRHKDPISSLD